jgi:hypothetical protein
LTIRYRSKDGHYTIQATQISDNEVEFAREELDQLVNYTIMPIREFDNMLEEEGWTEALEEKEEEDRRFS